VARRQPQSVQAQALVALGEQEQEVVFALVMVSLRSSPSVSGRRIRTGSPVAVRPRTVA
jgi:hypothetical protein